MTFHSHVERFKALTQYPGIERRHRRTSIPVEKVNIINDIMEFVGYMPDSVFGTVHTEAYNHTIGTQKTKGLRFKDLSTAFHVYAIEWTKDRIDFYVDDQKYSEFRNEGTGAPAWPFDQEFHIILNIAVGGNWGGKYGVDDSVFPQRMLVDYVRVYQ